MLDIILKTVYRRKYPQTLKVNLKFWIVLFWVLNCSNFSTKLWCHYKMLPCDINFCLWRYTNSCPSGNMQHFKTDHSIICQDNYKYFPARIEWFYFGIIAHSSNVPNKATHHNHWEYLMWKTSYKYIIKCINKTVTSLVMLHTHWFQHWQLLFTKFIGTNVAVNIKKLWIFSFVYWN